MNQPIGLKYLILIPFVLVCFALPPTARAVCQEGCLTQENTVLGDDALSNNTTGLFNTATGFDALLSNTSGNSNTATGAEALPSNTTGSGNTANGSGALNNNTFGDRNTATGASALHYNTVGRDNTATGTEALYSNTTGADNTATGFDALLYNTTGYYNTATGYNALYHNNADNNTATGYNALYHNNADNNTANGFDALYSNTTGTQNTASGVGTLYNNQTGNYNTATGLSALHSNTNGNSNTADGINALFNNRTGSLNVALGDRAGLNLTTGSNNIVIGAGVLGAAGDANTIRIGKSGTQQRTFVAGIYGKTANGGIGVFINSNGQLGTVQSSAKYKQDIKPMDKASEAILALKPVTFRYKKELDPEGIPQFGLVAEDVEKVDADLVARDADGKVNTVRYEAVNAMLLNEFLKAHQRVQELEANAARQQKQIEALTAGLQKVSAQIELNKSAPQVTQNNE
jgi:hypothetical protein